MTEIEGQNNLMFGSVKRIIGVAADNKENLINFLGKYKENLINFLVKYNAPILAVTMPCNAEVSYAHLEDIPDMDVPCPCGNPNHWIIKYTDGDKI